MTGFMPHAVRNLTEAGHSGKAVRPRLRGGRRTTARGPAHE